MLAVVTSLLVVLCLWMALRLRRYYRKWTRLLAPLPQLTPHHWFYGALHVAKTLETFLQLCQTYTDKYSPSMFYYWVLCLYPVPVVTHPETIKKVLQASNVPKNRGFGGPYRMLLPWLGDGLLVSNSKKWERNRRLLTPAFHFDILKPYVSTFHEVADIFTDKISELCKVGSSVDIYPHVSKATLDTMLRCALSYEDRGVQEGDQHPYVRANQRLTYLLVTRVMNPYVYNDFIYSLTANYREFTMLCDYVHTFSRDIIEKRKRALTVYHQRRSFQQEADDPSQLKKRHLDFLDILLTAKDADGEGLTDLEIRDEVDTFMFEGHDTTASGISWILYSLAKHSDMQHKVRQEIDGILQEEKQIVADDLPRLDYTTCFIKETLRMYSPVPGFTRKIKTPLTVDDVTFPTGTVIDVYPCLLHHNPAVWENHTEFIPERFTPENTKDQDPFAFLPFSAGQRNCIGQHFAMNEIKVIITRVVSRFHISLDPTHETIPFPEVVLRAKKGIYLHFKPRETV